jgi:hypothetical protein
MKDWDPTGKRGPKMPFPDVVKVKLVVPPCRQQNTELKILLSMNRFKKEIFLGQ